jgi:hypothetical protein
MHMNALTGNTRFGYQGQGDPTAKIDVQEYITDTAVRGVGINANEIKFRRSGTANMSLFWQEDPGKLTFETTSDEFMSQRGHKVMALRTAGVEMWGETDVNGNMRVGDPGVGHAVAKLDIRDSFQGLPDNVNFNAIGINPDEIKFRHPSRGNMSIFYQRDAGKLTFESTPDSTSMGARTEHSHPIMALRTAGVEMWGQVEVDGEIVMTSDRRLKKDIEPLARGMEDVMQLDPVSYHWKNQDATDEQTTPRNQLGLIAQEVEEIIPELVNTNEEGIKSVNYIGLIPVLIKSIQDLKKETEELRRALEQKVD